MVIVAKRDCETLTGRPNAASERSMDGIKDEERVDVEDQLAGHADAVPESTRGETRGVVDLDNGIASGVDISKPGVVGVIGR